MDKRIKILFAGGGTGGHLYPAVAIAEELLNINPHIEIAFVGNKNKIEGRVVPTLGYQFYHIWISGLQRKFTLSNLLFPVKVIFSMIKSLYTCMKFKPDIAVGSGGYVSGPAIWAAKVMGAKVVLLEINSYPGLTTRLLEKYADEIHITFEDTIKYLRVKDKIKISGSPVRTSLKLYDKKEAKEKLGLNDKFTILIIGGSLGAATINKGIADNIEQLNKLGIQIIWQTGRIYYEQYMHLNSDNIKVFNFIDDMQTAFSAADLVISRAGASAISEISMLKLPVILVPSPNVAENHQYYNAKALADKNAAILIEDKNFAQELVPTLNKILENTNILNDLSKNIELVSNPNATNIIANSILKILNN